MPRRVELAIIGGGPAGLAAGLYAARARMDVVLLERLGPGGQVLLTDWVENYPGFPEGLSGYDLVENLKSHAAKFGLRTESAEVRRLRFGAPHTVEMPGESLAAGAVIIASGASPNRLGVPGEGAFTGRGVSFCATCDGPFFRGQTVAVVGGGDTAVGEAVYLTRFAEKVYVVHRRGEFRAAQVLQERLFAHEKVEVLWDTVVEAVEGNTGVEAVRLRNLKSQERRRLPVSGVFIWIGVKPNLDFLTPGELETDEWGFLVTDTETRTSRPGVFVAGDVRAKALRQIANAVGEGAVAAFQAKEYLAGLPQA
jgi:thioredoxin reductase (NADPH)